MPARALAVCGNGPNPGVEQEFASSAAVVVAKMIKVQDWQGDKSDTDGLTSIAYIAHAVARLKGDVNREIGD